MAKQDDYVRTQVRLEKDVYAMVKDYANANEISMNETINTLLFNALMREISQDNFTQREKLLELANNNLQGFNLKELRDVCSIIGYISISKSH